MNEKQGKKQGTLIVVLALLTLMIAITGATFAYYMATIKGNEEASSVLIKTANLTIEYKTLNEIKATNVTPASEYILNFTISNTNEDTSTVGYNLNWNITQNNFVLDDLVYSLSATSNKSGDTFVTKTKEVMPKTSTVIGTGIIPAGNVQTYTLKVEFLETSSNQNIDQNKTFVGKIEVTSN